jgi:rhodanese-related sulfurtransferase
MILIMINIKSLLMLAIVAIIAVSCAKIFSKGASNAKALEAFANVGVDEFQAFIANPVVQLLDVRTRDEFDEGHIAGATLIDVNDSTFVEQAMAVIDKQRPVAVYCRSGRRSARAASLLTEQGYTVTNLGGGVMAWQDAGKSLVK